MPLPESTYRLQFHAGFTFRDATAIVPYLHALGVTHVYASPYLKARPGSTHGYDVIDHCSLNPELGTEGDYNAMCDALAKQGMSHILDTVPNHVGVATNDNTWWNDVLEHGRASKYAKHFDIAWRGSPRPELHDKVLLPVLGGTYGDVLEKGELRLTFEHGALWVFYYDRWFPVATETYGLVFGHSLPALRRKLPSDDANLADYLKLIETGESSGYNEDVVADLEAMTEYSEPIHAFIQDNVRAFNGTAGDPRSFDLLDQLLNAQHYRLAYWRTASDEINYRRFFDINDLAALGMEHAEVFEETHELTFRLIEEGRVAGLRIDHPDGLYDPEQYFQRLQEKRKGLYVLVEKILAPDEPLPTNWPVHGTSGYDFLILANGLFVDSANEQAFTKLWQEWTGDATSFEDLVYAKKKLILKISLASELQMLAHRLDRIAQQDRRSRDFTLRALREGLREVIACFPVYRSYVTTRGVSETDVRQVNHAVEHATKRNPATEPTVFRFIGETVFGRPDFAGKFQQLTAPVTAKGIEDTAFYLYNRFVSLNEVGGEPGHFGTPPEKLHAYLADRQKHWPHAMSTLSTHDTKRSEDVRARLNVLSELPEEWAPHVKRWGELNARHRVHNAPDRNEEYLIYQTLIGAWPLEPWTADEYDAFVKRVQAYLVKAMREAKVNTSWTNPNEAHESAVSEFIAAILDESRGGAFLADLRPFRQRVSKLGMVNSLAQTVLRLTAPGVPDTYQGTELWDFSLVDPDNRRPVDYGKRRKLLEGLDASPAELMATPEDGRVKLFVTSRLLKLRRERPGLFTAGEYIPLRAEGEHAANVFAFARRHEGKTAVVVIPRLASKLGTPAAWGDTRVLVPSDLDARRNLLTDVTLSGADGRLRLSGVLGVLPVAVLV